MDDSGAMTTDGWTREGGTRTGGAPRFAVRAGDIAPPVPGFEVGDRLGAGASGTVWSAVRERDGLLVALKVLHGARAGAAAEAAREVSVLGRLADEHLVRLHDALEIPSGQTVLVLDHAAGGSLGAAVRARGHLTPGETVTVLTPIASAIGRLHLAGVVHGDLSPGNILLSRSGRPLVGDLGTSLLVGEPVAEARGTNGFVAPEVLAGGAPDPASDVFSLGAVGWFCLTGTAPDPAPWRGRLVDALLREGACVAGEPARLDPRYAVLAGLVESCLAQDPADRPEADALAVAVFDAAPAQPLPLLAPGDELSELTHRIREAASIAPAQRRRLRPLSRPARARRRRTPNRAPSRPVGRHAVAGRASARRVLTAVGSAAILLAGALATSAVLARREPAAAHPLGSAAGPAGPRAATPATSPRSRPIEADATGATQARPAVDEALVGDPAAPRRYPVGLLDILLERRAAAWRAGRAAGLGEVDAPGSAALTRDMALLAEVQRAGLRYRGLRHVVVSAMSVRAGPRTARLRARVDTTAYVIEGDGPDRARPRKTGPPALVDLVWTGAGWRVGAVAAAR